MAKKTTEPHKHPRGERRRQDLAKLDENTLIARAQGNDSMALEELVRRHELQVLRFGLRMCGNQDEAEDLVQDTFLTMTRSLEGCRAESSLSTWLYTIARSVCIKRRRRSKFAPKTIESIDNGPQDLALQLPDAARLPDEEVAGGQMQRALDSAIAALKPMYREVLILRDIEGLSAPQVSESLGLSIQAIKSRLHRARETVRLELAPILDKVPIPEPLSAACLRSVKLFSEHIDGEIDAKSCAKMEQHIKKCPHCGAVCHSLKETLALCRSSGKKTTAVPEALQRSVREALRGYVANRVRMS